MEKASENKETISFSAKVINFIQRNRMILFGILGGIILSVIVLVVAIAIIDATKVQAIEQVESFSERYDKIRFESDDAKKDKELSALVDELKSFAASHSAYAGARALNILAGIYADKKEWAEAEKAWAAIVDKLPKSYLAPVALYNAATAAEDRGDFVKAIELYTKAVDSYGDDFPLAPRAYFAIGRLQETQKNNTGAIAAYQKMVEKWPTDNWTKLAQSRILFITANQK
ncbi:tetratricopeptide repeat protein [Gracilinema caldarium]|uniref:Tetratricopeptide TPR_2 repeat-containing protein n=1 Tax=Gracilinema caldarium (strain ATCC 51460 / DSM 7334 / H1) TaxID=744872 RepID=F8F3F1_GRAC1|nr:tetratricopeptide repeat protein [Gracilinema caldarium]AEJ19527.1 Tetratricopeptide TPR_2 repeat-containing protein [Gracilinema caldarium DSM 7334]